MDDAMKISILDDYTDTVRHLRCFDKLPAHDVTIWNDHVQDTDKLAMRLEDAEILVLIRERTRISAPLLTRLPKLKLISQRSACPHIDLDACRQRGIIVSSNLHAGTPSYCHGRTDLGARAGGHPAYSATGGVDETRKVAERHRSYASGKMLGIFSLAASGARWPAMAVLLGWMCSLGEASRSRQRASTDRYAAAGSKEEFFERCDVISFAHRLVAATQGA